MRRGGAEIETRLDSGARALTEQLPMEKHTGGVGSGGGRETPIWNSANLLSDAAR